MTITEQQIFTPAIIFFDIDDTLSRDGILAEHNKSTLEQLAKTEIKVVIATGRAKPMLPEDIIDLHDSGVIDAIICMNGQYSFTKNAQQDQKIKHYPLSKAQAKLIVDICQQQDIIYKFESTTHIGWSGNSPRHELLRKLIDENHHFMIDPDFYKANDVYQCSVFFEGDNEQLAPVNFADYGLKLVHWHAMGADILPIEASKARAVKDICDYYEVSPADCMAFGDGNNDIEMFELVGCPVAMADGAEILKQTALAHNGKVTGSIEENGIQTALTEYGVFNDDSGN
ncbi:HAD family hydrolase [Psychrobacter sp. HD31]|uniref:Cof-type HAD-IIB family hydrolase n=1 Tax=Psychrobacter sp. HD31 TaxID=3112003 RepID=UPI003DA3409C